MLDKKNSDFTQGNILRKLLLFMVPILGALVLQAAYGAVDLLVVGRFGSTSGLSATTSATTLPTFELIVAETFVHSTPSSPAAWA